MYASGDMKAMDLGHPINAVTPPLLGRALEVLSGTTRPLSGREIGRIIGEGSPNGVWNALRRLERQGLVLTDRRANATYYSANRDHLAWSAVESLARLRVSLVASVRSEFEQWDIAPIHASIFGSFARGDADTDSDLDILVIRPATMTSSQSDDWDAQVARLQDRVWRWTGNHCQVFAVDADRLAAYVRADDPLVSAWVRDEMLLVGHSIARHVKEVE